MGIPAKPPSPWARSLCPRHCRTGSRPDREALKDRPDLKQVRLEEGAAERFTKAEHDLYYPNVGGGRHGRIRAAGYATSPAGTAPSG